MGRPVRIDTPYTIDAHTPQTYSTNFRDGTLAPHSALLALSADDPQIALAPHIALFPSTTELPQIALAPHSALFVDTVLAPHMALSENTELESNESDTSPVFSS